tara:strand:- start:1601 stop:1972 length:372 start_codon:yes stop_codon:yes gene_type:complete
MSNNKANNRRNIRRRNRSKKTSVKHPTRNRLVIYRSLKHFEAQVINDFEGKTIISVSSKEKKLKPLIQKAKSKIEVSRFMGVELAKRVKKKKIKDIVLDRNGYPYHGRVEAFASAIRSEGIDF